jgi:hypothetical protein
MEIGKFREPTADATPLTPEALHSCTRGTVTIGFLLMSMTLYVSVAGIWNTGVVVDQKIQAQVAADAAAHGAATQMSSTINRITMLNMLILRANSANVIYQSCVIAAIAGVATIAVLVAIEVVKMIASIAAAGTYVPVGLANIAALVPDATYLARFLFWFGRTKFWEFFGIIDECRREQNNLRANLGTTIQDQVDALNAHLSNKYKVYVANTENFNGIVRPSNYGERLLMLYARVWLADAQWGRVNLNEPNSPGDPEESWKFPTLRSQAFFPPIIDSWVRNIMRIGWYGSLGLLPLANSAGSWGYELSTRQFLSEWPGDEPSRDPFKVIAVAERTNSSNTFMARGFFKPVNRGDTVLAVAQAETQHVYSDTFKLLGDTIPLLKGPLDLINGLPWRMWSSMGACWQGRLMQVEPRVLEDSLEKSSDLKDRWEKNTQLLPNSDKNVFLH